MTIVPLDVYNDYWPKIMKKLQYFSKLHVVFAVRQKLLQFDWDVLPHPPYSPDLAPSDYYLSLSLKNSLRGKCLKFVGEIKTHLDEYFARLNNFGKRAFEAF